MNPIAILKSKGLSLLCIVLATLLTVSYFSGKSTRNELDQTKEKLLMHVTLNKKLSDENVKFARELNEAPKQYIEVVKEVMRESCNGEVKQQLIDSLKTQRETVDEKNTADIDDKLPADLIKLLK